MYAFSVNSTSRVSRPPASHSLSPTGVGKSCLLLQFTDKRFQPVHDLTIGKWLLRDVSSRRSWASSIAVFFIGNGNVCGRWARVCFDGRDCVQVAWVVCVCVCVWVIYLWSLNHSVWVACCGVYIRWLIWRLAYTHVAQVQDVTVVVSSFETRPRGNVWLPCLYTHAHAGNGELSMVYSRTGLQPTIHPLLSSSHDIVFFDDMPNVRVSLVECL